jgi:hypothetical protein
MIQFKILPLWKCIVKNFYQKELAKKMAKISLISCSISKDDISYSLILTNIEPERTEILLALVLDLKVSKTTVVLHNF